MHNFNIRTMRDRCSFMNTTSWGELRIQIFQLRYVILIFPILFSFKNNVEIETDNTILSSTFRHPIFSVFPAKTLYVFVISIMHATCHKRLLEFISIIKCDVLCKAMELFITHFFLPPDTSVLLGPNIYFAIFLSITLYQSLLLKSILMQKKSVPNYSLTFLQIIYVAIGQSGTNFLCVSRKLN